MPRRDYDVGRANPCFARLFFAFDSPADRAVAKGHIDPDDPSQERSNDGAAHDGFHSARV